MTSKLPATEADSLKTPIVVASGDLLGAIIKYLANIGIEATPQTTIKQLQAEPFDSLDEVELLIDLENDFMCNIEDDILETLKDKPETTLAEVSDAIAKHISA